MMSSSSITGLGTFEHWEREGARMSKTQAGRLLILFVGLALGRLGGAQEAKQSEREAMYRRYLEFPSYVKGGKVEPHWMADGRP